MFLALNIVTVLTLWVGGAAVIEPALNLGLLVAVTQYVHCCWARQCARLASW